MNMSATGVRPTSSYQVKLPHLVKTWRDESLFTVVEEGGDPLLKVSIVQYKYTPLQVNSFIFFKLLKMSLRYSVEVLLGKCTIFIILYYILDYCYWCINV